MKNRYLILLDLINTYKCTNLLEIGVYKGDTSIEMIKCAQKYNRVTYTGFDLFKEGMTNQIYKEEYAKMPPSLHNVQRKLEATGAKIHLIQGNTKETLPIFVQNNEDINLDLVFIDGGHSKDTLLSDWNNIKVLIKPSTIVVFDDYLLDNQFGCKDIIDNLDATKYNYYLTEKTDSFKSGYRIKMAIVTKKEE